MRSLRNFLSLVVWVVLTGASYAQTSECGNQLLNPGFEYGFDNWIPYINGAVSGSFQIVTASPLSGTQSALVNIASTTGTAWHVQLKHTGHVLEAGRTYRVSFRARATANRPITLSLQQEYGARTVYGTQNVNLTTSTETYTIDFAVTQNEPVNAELIFNLGASAANVYLDDVELFALCQPVDCSGGIFNNYISNGEFNNDIDEWQWWADPAITFNVSQNSSSQLSGTNSAFVSISTTTGVDWHAQLYKPGLVIYGGTDYRISFQARATSARQMYVSLQQTQSPYREIAGQTVELTTTPQTFTFTLNAPFTETEGAGLYFHLGSSNADVYIDAVTLAQECSATSTEADEICGNGIDDDGDGYIDDFDPDCFGCTASTYGLQGGVLESGTALRPGAVYLYRDAAFDTDVRVKLNSFSHSDIEILDMDLTVASGGYNLALQPYVNYHWINPDGTTDPIGERYVEFEFTFYKAGTNILQPFEEASLSAIDVDGDGGSVREFVEASDFVTYSTTATTNLTLSGALKAKSSLTTASAIDETAVDHMITYSFTQGDRIVVRYGAEWDGSSSSAAQERLNSLYFRCYDLPLEVVCPTVDIRGPSAICLNHVMSLTASTTGTSGTCDLQWQESSDNVTWTNLNGERSANFVSLAPTSARYYRVRMNCTGNPTCDWISSTAHRVDSRDCGEICDNGVDDDGDGLADCFDPDCQSGSQSAIAIAQGSGVGNASDALGTPDGAGAKIYDLSDTLTLYFANTLTINTDFSATLRRRPAPYVAGTARVEVYQSADQVTWVQHPVTISLPENGPFSPITLSTTTATRYLRFGLEDGAGDDFDLDAVTYAGDCPIEICGNGLDDDGDGAADGLDPSCCENTVIIDQPTYSLHSFDSEETVGEMAPAGNAIDGNPSTYWHTRWNGTPSPMPHFIVLDLGSTKEVSGVKYLPRQHHRNGRIANYEVYLSEDASTWGTPIATGIWADESALQTALFTNTEARYVKLQILSEVGGNPWTSIAELYVIECIGAPPEYCNNGIDDDGDGVADCNDQDCPPANTVTTVTQN